MDDPSLNRSHLGLRWATEHLTFSLSERKFVVSCRWDAKLPHLTLSWGNRSGEIDLHLNYGEDRYLLFGNGQAPLTCQRPEEFFDNPNNFEQ